MLKIKELQQIVELKGSLGIPLNEGSCFGVRDPRELRPPSNLPKMAAASTKEDKKK